MTWTASFEAQSKVISRFGTAAAAASWANADNETGHIDAEWSRPFLGFFFNQLIKSKWMNFIRIGHYDFATAEWISAMQY